MTMSKRVLLKTVVSETITDERIGGCIMFSDVGAR